MTAIGKKKTQLTTVFTSTLGLFKPQLFNTKFVFGYHF